MMVIGTFVHFQLILIGAVCLFSSCLPVFIGNADDTHIKRYFSSLHSVIHSTFFVICFKLLTGLVLVVMMGLYIYIYIYIYI